MKKIARLATIGILLTMSVPGAAESISVEPFQGPRSEGIRQSVIASLRNEGHQLDDDSDGSEATLRVSGKIRRRGKRLILVAELRSASGQLLKQATFGARGVDALKKKLSRQLISAFQPAIDEAGDETGSESPEPEETDSSEIESDSDEEGTGNDGVFGWNARTSVGLKTLTRRFSYSGGLETTRPSYTLPLTMAADLRVSYSWRTNWFGELHATFPRNIDSRIDDGAAFPTSTFAMYAGALYQLSRFHASLGYGNHQFSIENSESDRTPDIPSVSYHYLRLGAGYIHPIGSDYSVGTALGYRLVVAAGEIRNPEFFQGSMATGLDLEVFGNYNFSSNVYFRTSLEIERYSHTIVESKATDLYISLGVSAGVKL